MIATALALFFATCGLFALAVIAQAWLRHGEQALALRGALERCPEMRTFTYRIVMREPAPRRMARVIAFPARTAPQLVTPLPGLRAA